jgi:hypothetical protein
MPAMCTDRDVFRASLDESDGGDALRKWRLRRRRGRLSQLALGQVPHERSACQKERAADDDWKGDVFHGSFSPPTGFIELKLASKSRVEQTSRNKASQSAQDDTFPHGVTQAR